VDGRGPGLCLLSVFGINSAENLGFSNVEPLESATRKIARQADIDRQIDKRIERLPSYSQLLRKDKLNDIKSKSGRRSVAADLHFKAKFPSSDINSTVTYRVAIRRIEGNIN
jgi:hypothetical protein